MRWLALETERKLAVSNSSWLEPGGNWKESCLFFDFVFIKCRQKTNCPLMCHLAGGEVLVLKIGLYTAWLLTAEKADVGGAVG